MAEFKKPYDKAYGFWHVTTEGDMPEFDSEEAFDAYFAEKTAAVAPYRNRQGRLVLDDIHDLPEVVEKVFAGHPEFMHTFFHEDN